MKVAADYQLYRDVKESGNEMKIWQMGALPIEAPVYYVYSILILLESPLYFCLTRVAQ